MNKQVDGVPENINRARYLELIGLAGFDTDRVMELAFRPGGIYAVVKWRDADGHERFDRVSNEIIKETFFIPVVD